MGSKGALVRSTPQLGPIPLLHFHAHLLQPLSANFIFQQCDQSLQMSDQVTMVKQAEIQDNVTARKLSTCSYVSFELSFPG
jgi:hypothetical protein